MGTYGRIQLITPPPPNLVMQFINQFSLALGLAGLLVIPGLLSSKTWGYWSTLTLGILTIVFDMWAFLTTAQTAAAGIFIPAILILYLVPRHASFLHGFLNR
jgi:lysylphosphatidylglycerol synthetase-like protein (DUF2156 family)